MAGQSLMGPTWEWTEADMKSDPCYCRNVYNSMSHEERVESEQRTCNGRAPLFYILFEIEEAEKTRLYDQKVAAAQAFMLKCSVGRGQQEVMTNDVKVLNGIMSRIEKGENVGDLLQSAAIQFTKALEASADIFWKDMNSFIDGDISFVTDARAERNRKYVLLKWYEFVEAKVHQGRLERVLAMEWGCRR